MGTPVLLQELTWNLKIAQALKENKENIIWTIHLHDFGFKMFIFPGWLFSGGMWNHKESGIVHSITTALP